MKALCVIRNVWIPALIPCGASAFMHTWGSLPRYQFESDAIEASQHHIPTHHITSTTPSMQNIAAHDYHSSSALPMFPAGDKCFGSGMPPSVLSTLDSSISWGQQGNQIHPMYDLESQHPSGQAYSGITTRSPNSDREFKNDGSEPKRKMTDESDALPSKKNKQTVGAINHHRKPNTDTNNKIPLNLTYRFREPLLEEDDKQVKPFNAYPLELREYAFLNTVTFPSTSYWKSKYGSYNRDVLTNSCLWIGLQGADKAPIELPPLIKDFVELRQDSESNPVTVKRASALLEEIFFRNNQFLLAITSPDSTPKRYARRYDYPTSQMIALRLQEQRNFLAWLVELFNARVDAQGVQAKPRNLNENSTMRLSLEEMLFDYFTEDLEIEEEKLGLWVKEPNKDQKSPQSIVTYSSAIKTKVAFNTLGTYYKETNLTKWKMLFKRDYHFANFFGLFKHYEHNKMLHRLHENYLRYFESLKLLPWEKQVQPLDDSSKQICHNFSKALGNFNWFSTDFYFKYVANKIEN